MHVLNERVPVLDGDAAASEMHFVGQLYLRQSLLLRGFRFALEVLDGLEKEDGGRWSEADMWTRVAG